MVTYNIDFQLYLNALSNHLIGQFHMLVLSPFCFFFFFLPAGSSSSSPFFFGGRRISPSLSWMIGYSFSGLGGFGGGAITFDYDRPWMPFTEILILTV